MNQHATLFTRSHEDLFYRVQWLLFFRLAVAVIGIALALVNDLAGSDADRVEPAAYGIFLAAVVLDLGYLSVVRRVHDLRRFAAVQIAIDLVIETALCYVTGGVYSYAAILYFASILATALCVSGRSAFILASTATAALAGVQVAYHFAFAKDITLPLVSDSVLQGHSLRLGRVAASLISQGFAFHLVAALSAWLAQELSRRPLYGEILEKMAEGLVAVDGARRIIFVNREALRLLAYTESGSMVGREIREVFRRKEDLDILESLLRGDPMTVEVQVEARDGTKRDIEVKTSILRDDTGEVRGTVGIFTDLTMKKQAEEAERRAERLEGIEALAMGIAHEVRNPLASIRGCVQELGRLSYLGEDERALAKIVCRESDRLDAIIGEFLQFARLKPPELGAIDLASLLREVVLLLKNRAAATGSAKGSSLSMSMSVSTSTKVGGIRFDLDLIENAHVRADLKQLTQVFLNLGINAIEAMEGKGGALSITLRDTRSVRHAPTPRGGFRILEDVRVYEVTFEDTGAGIAGPELEKIFEPFFTTKPGGTGLGLAIAERIVKQHGGTIVAESMPGCGATFKVRLPAETAAPAAQPQPTGAGS